MEVFGMVVFVAFIALLVRSLFKKPDGKKLQKFVDNWEWAEPRDEKRLLDDINTDPACSHLLGNIYHKH